MLEDNCEKHEGPMSDLSEKHEEQTKLTKQTSGTKPAKGSKRREQSYVVRDLITCLALCHNVTPVYPDEFDKTIKEF